MIGGVVAKRYADALFSVAQERNAVEGVESELAAVTTALRENPQLVQMLQHPAVATSVKKQRVNELFGKAVSPIVLNFLNLLVDSRRQNELPAIYESYLERANETRGQAKAHVETAIALSEQQIQDLGEKLGAAFGRKLQLTTSVNPDLIAGARIQVGDRLVDASVKGRLEQFAQQLKRNKVR